MPQRKEFTDIKVRKVWFLHGTGTSIPRIAKEIRRSKTAVKNVIKLGIDGSYRRDPEQNQNYNREIEGFSPNFLP